MTRRAFWFVGALFVYTFLFAGVVLLIWGIKDSIEAFGSQSWPVTGGEIVFSQQVVSVSKSEAASSDTGGTGSRPVTMYKADVRYHYQVGMHEYTGRQVSLDDLTSSDPEPANQVLKHYPLGKKVQVYYNPKDPGSSVLEPGPGSGLLIPLILGLVFSILGGLLTRAYFRALHRSQKKTKEFEDLLETLDGHSG